MAEKRWLRGHPSPSSECTSFRSGGSFNPPRQKRKGTPAWQSPASALVSSRAATYVRRGRLTISLILLRRRMRPKRSCASAKSVSNDVTSVACCSYQRVGVACKPPEFLKSDDTVTIEIERIGQLINPVATWHSA